MRVYLAPQNIPRAISVLTLGNTVILYCIFNTSFVLLPPLTSHDLIGVILVKSAFAVIHYAVEGEGGGCWGVGVGGGFIYAVIIVCVLAYYL